MRIFKNMPKLANIWQIDRFSFDRRRGVAAAVMLPIPLLLLVFAAQAPAAPARRVLVYVDAGAHDEGAETAAVLAAARQRGVDCMALWSEPTANALCDRCAADAEAVRRVREMQAPPVGQEREWAAHAIPNAQLAGVLCGSDGGLATAERLQHALLPARSNQINPARRDKYWMNEACREMGMKVVAQSNSQDWCAYAPSLPPPELYSCILWLTDATLVCL